MVRFSCFNGHINSHKPKKMVDPVVGAKSRTSQDISTIQSAKTTPKSTSLNSVFQKAFSDGQIGDDANNFTSSVAIERGWKSEEMKGKLDFNIDVGICHMGLLKRSQSVGSKLCHEGRSLCDNDTEEEIDHEFSCDFLEQNGLVEPKVCKDPRLSPSENQKPLKSDSVKVSSDLVNDGSVFSTGDPQNSEKEGQDNSDIALSVEVANNNSNHMSPIAPMIVKSHSSPNICPLSPTFGGGSFKYSACHSRSSEDLRLLEMRWKEVSVHEVRMQAMQEQGRGEIVCGTEKNNFENYLDDGYDSYDYSGSAKDWIVPVTHGVNLAEDFEGERSIQQSDESSGRDFRTKRIEEWVNDLHHCSPVKDTDELLETKVPAMNDFTFLNGSTSSTAAKVDDKMTPGMEAAKRYISSLSASASTAQLSNHGLAVIPFLGAFVSLRVLNLSGNSIVRITAGALPRGLHMLNLSKNNISTIEGLRDLTRLRVLDLSYNRILRIGHGLASCSSLKELYLAGNKISEVEGLHRLLKLNVLDLRFNKISTAKCLGQLAANYNSLQAISLEGNPAQKNVGDEQLKKHLQGLLPHLVYFNRQPIKTSTLKDAADRSVRLGMSDRGLRSDKPTRKASHGISSSRLSSAAPGRKGQAAVNSPKWSKTRHARPPPSASGTKVTPNYHHNFDIGSKLLQLRSGLSIRRSRSEGTIGVL